MIVIPKKMGRLNMGTLLGRLRKVGVASRADLAKSLGMSQPTAGRIADELLELGVLEEVLAPDGLDGSSSFKDAGGSRLGRPGRMLRLDSTRPRFLAIQLGVVKTNFAVLPVGFKGQDNWTLQLATTNSEKKWAAQLKLAAARLPQRDFWGVLLSVPGVVDEPRGKILFSPNQHWAERADLPKLIQRVWKAPVVVVHEQRALALGYQSAEPFGEDFMLMDFNEGVGSAAIVGGKIYFSTLPINGEIGHSPVAGNRRACGCGATGCVETLISIGGLLQSFAEHQPTRAEVSWPALKRHIERVGVTPWLAETLEATAAVIACSLNVLGVRRLVVSGALTELPPAVLQHLFAAVERGSMWARFGKVECISAPRRWSAGLVAAGIDRLVVSMPLQHGAGQASE